MSDLKLSAALQARLLGALLENHPLPWKFHSKPNEWICEVFDAKRDLVVICMNDAEAIELVEAAMMLSNANMRNDLEVDRAMRDETTMSTKPKSPSELFDNLLPLALTRNAVKAREIGAIYCFKVSGTAQDSGTWVVDCAAFAPTCTRNGDASKATCTITLSADNLMKIIADQNQAMQLYFTGQLQVAGDPMQAMKLKALFELIP